MVTFNILLDQNINYNSTNNNNKQLEFLNLQQHIDEKLPLNYAWSTYFYKADKQQNWKQNVI
jgi:hypothetical protein